jgi:hypothetical protein
MKYNQGVNEEIDIPKDDHSTEMARGDLYKLAKYAVKLLDMINEDDRLEGWQLAKITKASDYISSVYHRIEYEQMAKEAINTGPRQYQESVKQQLNSFLHESWKKYKAKG